MLLLNSVETFVFLTISPNSQINTQATYSYIPYSFYLKRSNVSTEIESFGIKIWPFSTIIKINDFS